MRVKKLGNVRIRQLVFSTFDAVNGLKKGG